MNDRQVNETRLRHLLDALALNYAIRLSDRGAPYAGLKVELGSGGVVNVTTLLRGNVLQITAHSLTGIDPTQERLARLNGFNRGWGLGRVYANPDSGQLEVGLGVYLQDEQRGVTDARDALQVTCETAQLIKDAYQVADEPLGRHLLSIQAGRSAPRAAGTVTSDLAEIMAEAGAPMRTTGDAVLVERFYEENHTFVVELQEQNQRYLQIRSWNEPVIAQRHENKTLRELQSFNRDLPTGAIILDPADLRAHWLIRLPLAWIEFRVELGRWILDTAAAATAAIALRLESIRPPHLSNTSIGD